MCPFGPSGGYPFALCGFLSLQGGILHNFGPPTVGAPPQVAKNGPFPKGPIQRIYQRRGRVDFPIFGLVVVNFLHFGFVRLHFLSFWPCGPSFPCILALWAFISLHFGLVGLHFLAFWPCGPSFPCILALWAFISLHFGSILQFLAFWAFISLHFGLVGVHFLVFWPCGPSFPFILAFSGSASRVPPKSYEKWPVCPTSLQWIYQRRDRLHFEVFSFLGLHFCPFWPCGPSFPCISALWAFISLHFGLVGLHFLSFWPCGPSFPCILVLWAFISLHFGLACRPCGPSFPCILALWAFISLHFGLVGLHFLAFWPCGLSFPCILAFSGSASGVPPTSCQKWPVCPTSLQWIYQRRDRLHFAVFNLLGLHFLVFWPCGPSFPFILAFSGSASRVPPTSCEKLPVCPTSLQWIYQRRNRLHFEVFSFLGLHFCPFWPCGPSFPCILALWAFISLHFGLVGLHFLSFWPCGPSFPCILALWAFISLHFGLVGLHFLAFWPCGLSFPCILALWAFISLHFGSILQFLAFWAFISLHFGLVGIHFLVFWPCGPSFPFILAFSGSASRVPPTSCEKLPVCPTSLQWIYQRRDRLHFEVFSFLGLHFCPFWPCGPSFPCILALWAFISLHFGLVGLHFLAFRPCGPSFPCILALWAFISFHFGLVGLHFLAFWPCGLSFPCSLALWAIISLHFGLVGLHFLAFWPCGPSFPCILALWAFISLHFGLFGVSFWAPPHKLPEMARLPNVLTMDLSAL